MSSTPQENENVKAADFYPAIPFVPEKAFFPLHPSGVGVYYSWRECVKKFIWCHKWERKEVVYQFNDAEAMQWFINNDFGFAKREKP